MAAMPGGVLGSEALLGPGAGSDALIEGVRGKISTSGPDDRPGLQVDVGSLKPGRRARLSEHRPAQPVEHVDIAGKPVCERQPQNAVTDDGGICDVWCESDH